MSTYRGFFVIVTPPVERFHLPLNGYRGFCALHVFLHHVATSGVVPVPALDADDIGWPASLLRYGGPEMFFMISGYLVLASLQRTDSLWTFMRERVIRIYCAWAPTLVILTIVLRMFDMKVLAQSPPLHTLALFVGNFFLLPPLFPVPDLHYGSWTLTFEMLFYASLGLGAVLLRRPNPRRSLIGLWVAGCAAIVCVLPSTLFFVTGVLVLLKRDALERHRRYLRWPLLSFAIYLAAWRHTEAYTLTGFVDPRWWLSTRGIAAAVALLASLHLFACICLDTSRQLGFLRSRVFQWLGTVSYSLYLWHLLVMGVVKRAVLTFVVPQLGNTLGLVIFASASLALTAAVAWLSYTWLEARFGRWLRRRWARPAPSPAIADPAIANARGVVSDASFMPSPSRRAKV
jgi:exopolysaccharide production protein ExoZ